MWELGQPLSGCSTWESRHPALTGQHSGAASGGMGLTLQTWEKERKPCVLPMLALSSPGEPTLVVQIRESPCYDQLSYQAGPDPGLWDGLPQNLYYLQTVEMCERASPADPKLQDLYDTGQQQDNQEESSWGSNIYGVTEARDLESDQWLIAMNICKWRCVDKGVYCETHLTYYSFHGFYVLFCFIFVVGRLLFLFSFDRKVARVEGWYKGKGDEWDWGAGCETHNEWIKS